MEFLEQFNSERMISKMLKQLVVEEPLTIMEVCGTHTQAISKFGLRTVLPKNLKLVSGPGCPICVTPINFIDTALKLAQKEGVIIATFADLLKVPGSNSSLQLEQAKGQKIRTVYSPLDAVKIAQRNPTKELVFLAVGFETTAPLIALSIVEAKKRNLNNYSLLQGMKTMPAVMKKLAANDQLNLDAFLCPGHVAAIIGVNAFDFLAKDYNLAAAVAGFEVADILLALLKISQLRANQRAEVLNLYPRVVEDQGNQQALTIIDKVFKPTTSNWRGLGTIAGSGLELRAEYQQFAVQNKFSIRVEESIENNNLDCSCGEILMGIKQPNDCNLFATECTPSHPYGPCMISQEGSCNAYYANLYLEG